MTFVSAFHMKSGIYLPSVLLLVATTALLDPSAFAQDPMPWDSSVNTETKERYIPVELWSGAEWDGTRELRMPKVDAGYRHRESYQIKGPKEWKHPVTGKTYLVYERINPGRRASDAKWQLFAINDDRSGLGVNNSRGSFARRDAHQADRAITWLLHVWSSIS